MDSSSTWQVVADFAAREGAKAETIRKWKQRGIPARWKIAIAEHNENKLTIGDLAAFDPVPVESADSEPQQAAA